MRWKLLLAAALIASITATVLSTGGLFCCFHFVSLTWRPVVRLLVMVGVPLLSITCAAIFVYRHTSKLRRQQAMATVIFGVLLTLGASILLWTFLQQWKIYPS